LNLKVRVTPSLLFITLSIVISSCNQSDDTSTEVKKDSLGTTTQVIEAPPKSASEYINLSLQHYNDGEWQKSIEAGNRALSLNPNSPMAYNNICAAYVQLDNFDEAIIACNKALALRPDFPRARGNLNAAIRKKENN
jgi:Flp pilus assembly protein TadD